MALNVGIKRTKSCVRRKFYFPVYERFLCRYYEEGHKKPAIDNSNQFHGFGKILEG